MVSKVLGLIFCLAFGSVDWAHAEDWKGQGNKKQVSFGALTGLGMVDGNTGFALLGTVSKKIVEKGFVEDLNNSVSIEGVMGPVFLNGTTGLLFSAHLRWDFQKDETWTFYGLGGMGGNMMSVPGVGGVPSTNRFELTPRFGVGAFWKLTSLVNLRGEVSHNWVAVGVNLPL